MRRPSPEPPLPPYSVAVRVGLLAYALCVFVPTGLKLVSLTRLATWSWWWVLTALWLPWALVLVGLFWIVLVRLWKGSRV